MNDKPLHERLTQAQLDILQPDFNRGEMLQLLIDATIMACGPGLAKYMVHGPEGSFYCVDLSLATEILQAYDHNDEWIVTNLENP